MTDNNECCSQTKRWGLKGTCIILALKKQFTQNEHLLKIYTRAIQDVDEFLTKMQLFSSQAS